MSPDREASPSNLDIADYLAMGSANMISNTRNFQTSNESPQAAPYYV